MDSALHKIPLKSVAVAVSGGMDSLYSLLCLHERGLAACAVHGRFLHAPTTDPVPQLRTFCAQLGLPLFVVDARAVFQQQVIRPFAEAYAAAATPNPCVLCNERIKFGFLFDAACAHGAERLATGHYARMVPHPVYGPALRRGEDMTKDQSYFLAMVPRERLERSLFPLAALHKSEIADALRQRGIQPPLPGESQEICFVPDDAYRSFLQSQNVSLGGPGPILLPDGRHIGEHQGLWRYTQGQRRGLGIAWSEPLYVVEKSIEHNALIVGVKAELPVAGCLAVGANILVPRALWPNEVQVQVRYRQRAVPATVTLEGARIDVLFLDAQPPVAPGQLLVVYDQEGHVLAGATIRANIRLG